MYCILGQAPLFCAVPIEGNALMDQLAACGEVQLSLHVRPPIQNSEIFPVKSLQLEPPLSDRAHLDDGFCILHCFYPPVSNFLRHGLIIVFVVHCMYYTTKKIPRHKTFSGSLKGTFHGLAHAHESKCCFPARTCCIVYTSDMIMS